MRHQSSGTDGKSDSHASNSGAQSEGTQILKGVPDILGGGKGKKPWSMGRKSNQPSRAQCSNHRTTTDTSAINLLDSVSSRSCETMITPILPVLHGCLLALWYYHPLPPLGLNRLFFFFFVFPSLHPLLTLPPLLTSPPFIAIHIPYRLGGKRAIAAPTLASAIIE